MIENIRFTYLRDENTGRVITVARQFDRATDVVHYGISVNHWPLDRFDKRRGRQIAEGRLHKDPMVISACGQRPLVAVLSHLSTFGEQHAGPNSVNATIGRMAFDRLKLLR